MSLFSKSIVALTFTLLLGACSQKEAGTSVADIHAQRTQLSGQQVTVTGKVVKVNNGIMKRNFIHVSDGSGTGDTESVIVTSTQTANVDDQITVTGTMKLDTDFGMGYFYPTLIENAQIVKAQ